MIKAYVGKTCGQKE